jgi:subtilase family serine protease
LLACADDAGVVTELDDGNNCRASTTTVQVARPDLVVTVVSNPPPAIAPGGQFPVTDSVKNQAAVSSASSTIRYYLSADGQKGDGDTLLIASRGVPSLAAGASHAGAAITVTLPSTTALNTYYLLACADDTGIVTELDDSNNCRASATTVQVTRPDLVVTEVSNPPTVVARGGHFAATDTVKNLGAVLSPSSTTRYYLSLDGEKGSGDTLLIGSRGVPILPAGASSSGPGISLTIPSTTPPGLHYLLACVDDAAVVIETNENNNCKASSSRVTVGP